jgi:hypothetical protein
MLMAGTFYAIHIDLLNIWAIVCEMWCLWAIFYAGDSNECPFTTEISIYFCFSKNGHSLCQKNSIGHAEIFCEFLYFY